MALVNFANLDFDQIKQSITEYLRSNSNFSDYDFEGSNLSTIIDALAYNTYITSYNANMVSNEVFIDSATLRENVVSLARNIGYTPRSQRASRANISFLVDTSAYDTKPQTITLNKGLVANSQNFNNEAFTFSMMSDVTVPVINNVANFDNIDVYEGTYVTANFSYDNYNPQQRFVLESSNIDTSTIEVIVKPSSFSTVKRQYRLAESLFEVDGESPVYWIQEIEDSRYEIIFGDGVFGKKLEEPNFVEVRYIVTKGSSGNGQFDLSFSGKLTTSRDAVAIESGISLVTVNTPSFGGDDIESIESIKKYAPQIYSSQRRAVTSTDYENLLPTIYREAESVSVFGGEELSPPQFGKVFASIKPINGAYLSNLVKDNIKREIKKYSVGGIELEITDLKYLYIEVLSNVYYDGNMISSGDEVKSLVSTNINRYANSTEMNKFGARFKYSKFLGVIDNTNDAITSNITTIQMRRDLRASLNAFAEYEICFGNRFHIKNHGHGTHRGQIGYNIKSSGFQVSGIPGVVYLADSPFFDLNTGTVNLIRLNSPTEAVVVKRNVGTVDYIKGEIKLNPINIISTQLNKQFPVIEISAVPFSNDIIGLHDLYVQLDTNNVTINSINDRISSGYDISGSNYIVTSSFANGALVRGSTDAISIGRVTQETSGTTTTTTTTSSTTTSTTPTTPSTSTPTYSY
mgnify:FL=1|tara:strand:+ start:5876 stop:7942 length:2067 start_codon:yes stop_codon:yes gene_type:complete